jgi:coenzyme F420 hydrogenase subunit gamma
MGLLSNLKKILTGKKPEEPKTAPEPVTVPETATALEFAAAPEPVTVPKARSEVKPVVKPRDVKVEKKPEIQEMEEKPVAEKITIGHVHMSGCTGCLVSLADNYEGLFTLLDNYADLNYCLTLADVRDIPKMDVALVEGSVCINDPHSVEDIKKARKNATIVVALGACAAYGNITRFARGGQWNQPQHENYVPIGDLINVDVYLPACPPSPESIRNVAVMAYLLLRGTDEQKELAAAYLKPLMDLAQRGTEACGCDLIYDVINQGLCMGCGTCVATCPVRAISMEYGKPNIDRDLCIKCGACYAQCPRSFFNFDVMNQFEAIGEAIDAAMLKGDE